VQASGGARQPRDERHRDYHRDDKGEQQIHG
jgi:hypothetical protein